MKTQNIGPTHPDFNQKYPGFTQVQIIASNGDVVAQFFGISAKILAWDYISKKTVKPLDVPK